MSKNVNKKWSKLNKVLVLSLLIFHLGACGNTRFYIGIDDYGEAKRLKHDFETEGKGVRGGRNVQERE